MQPQPIDPRDRRIYIVLYLQFMVVALLCGKGGADLGVSVGIGTCWTIVMAALLLWP